MAYRGIQGYIGVNRGTRYTRVYICNSGYTGVNRGKPRYTRVYRGIQGYTGVYSDIQKYTGVYRSEQVGFMSIGTNVLSKIAHCISQFYSMLSKKISVL